MPNTIPPVILVPGITASVLHDEYEMPPEAVWSTVLRRGYDRITLHPEDQRYEFREPARVAPGGPFPLVYEDLVEELRDGLSEEGGAPVPVFPFGYDWRMPLDHTEAHLAAFVDEVIDRTLLMPHYRGNAAFRDHPAVTLIGHSMGGLIIAGYVQRHSGAQVDRVVTLATPFQGSYEAVLKVATGTADFGDDSGKARERRMARLTPALYHLLPGFGGVDPTDDDLETDLFHPSAWQPSVVRSIEAQVNGWDVSAGDLFRTLLDQARAHRDRVSGLELGDPGDADAHPGRLPKDRWLAIAGVDRETRVGLRVEHSGEGTPRFDLRSDERRNDWNREDGADPRDTGDGTVPLRGAIPPFLEESRLVCVAPGDFG